MHYCLARGTSRGTVKVRGHTQPRGAHNRSRHQFDTQILRVNGCSNCSTINQPFLIPPMYGNLMKPPYDVICFFSPEPSHWSSLQMIHVIPSCKEWRAGKPCQVLELCRAMKQLELCGTMASHRGPIHGDGHDVHLLFFFSPRQRIWIKRNSVNINDP